MQAKFRTEDLRQIIGNSVFIKIRHENIKYTNLPINLPPKLLKMKKGGKPKSAPFLTRELGVIVTDETIEPVAVQFATRIFWIKNVSMELLVFLSISRC